MNGAESKANDANQGFELLAPGKTFARYELVRCIGVGGMGAVFEATHVLLKKRVALKTMHSTLVRSEASRARFLREAETVARIRHPNVVDITDVGIEDGIPFLVMEYLEGEDLLHVITREGALTARAAVDYVLPIVAGLCAVHRLGIVHRDVKPENILLARDMKGAIVPKLIDFGVSKDLDASLRAGDGVGPHTVTGTPHYMSPEQARGAAQLDGRTDQYALGVLLYQCLTGKLPYESPSLLELIHLIDSGDYKPLGALRPDVPPALESAVHRAMARHPRDRYGSMELLGQDLLPFASERVRMTLERDFAESSLITWPTISAEAAAARAATTPGDPFGRPSSLGPQTASGVRVRENQAVPTGGVASAPASNRLTWLVAAFVVLALAFAGLAALLLSRGAQTPAATPMGAPANYRVAFSVRPEGASIELDGVLVGTGHIDRTLARDGREHSVRVSADGYESWLMVFVDQPPRKALVELKPLMLPALEPEPSVAPAPPDEPPAKLRHRPRASREPAREPAKDPVDIQLSR